MSSTSFSHFSHLLPTKDFVVMIETMKGKPFMFESSSPVTVHTIRRFIVRELKESIGLKKEDVLYPYQIVLTNPHTKEVYDKTYFNDDIHLVLSVIREDNRLTEFTKEDLTSLIAFSYFKNRYKMLEILDKYKSFTINPVRFKMLDDEATLMLLDTIYTNQTIDTFSIDENNEKDDEDDDLEFSNDESEYVDEEDEEEEFSNDEDETEN